MEDKMIPRMIICCLLISISIYGMVYWHANGENVISQYPFSQTYGTPSQIPCHIGEPNSSTSNCSFGQVVIYFAAYFSCIGLIAIAVAVIYSSFRTVNCWGGG
jgi:hypothetical protein